MNHSTEVAVTLTRELFDRLAVEAAELGVSMEWLVAALVADTVAAVGPLGLAV